METLFLELSSFFRWLLVSSVQVSVVICLILAIKGMVRSRLAVRWHYWLWLILLVRMVMPWGPASSFSVFTLASEAGRAIVSKDVGTVIGSEVTADVTNKVANAGTAEWTVPSEGQEKVGSVETSSLVGEADGSTVSFAVVDVLSLVWFTVAVGLAVLALGCNFRLWRIIKSKRPLTEGKILELLEDCKAEMGIQTIMGVVVSDKVKSPALFGVVRPRLLLPEGMLETLSTEELRYVFLHELGHLRRRDIYLGWLMVILQILHWFNPLVWFAFHRMRADRELACDGLVLSTMHGDKLQAYGQTIVNLFKGFSQIQYVQGVAGILENKSQLKRRIIMITRFKKGSYRWSVFGVVLLVILGFVALTNAEGRSRLEKRKPETFYDNEAQEISGGPGKHSSIQAMIDSARPCSTVIVPKGIYRNGVIIPKPLTLKGESRADCVLDVTDNKAAIFVDTKGKGKVIIEGFTIKWQLATSNKSERAFALGAKDSKIDVKDCRFVPLGNFKQSPVAIRALGFSNVSIDSCEFDGFDYVVCYNEGTKGKIQNSLIKNCKSTGIMLYRGASVDITANIVTRSDKHGVRSTGGTLRMKDNLIIENANRGVYLGNKSAKGIISNNIIMGNGTGIGGFFQSAVRIKNNLILDSSYAGIGFRDSCRLLVQDNIFQGNTRGLIMFEEQKANSNRIRRNTFWDNEVDTENFEQRGDCIVADPCFAEPAKGDFSLKAGSVSEHKQGLTNAKIFKTLWEKWQKSSEE